MESPEISTFADVSASPAEEQVQTRPVLQERKVMKVIVAVDDSKEGFYALQWALDTLFPIRPNSGVRPEEPNGDEVAIVTVVHVMSLFQPYAVPAGPAAYVTTSMIRNIKKAEQKYAAELLSHALQYFKPYKQIKVETLILEGDPKDMICQAAEQMHVDLLVIGSRGLGRIKRAFLGSVSDYCVNHSKCPVLVVKPQNLSLDTDS